MYIGYARVSTTGQSLETQLEQLSFCDKTFQEKISGASMERPELEHLMQIIRNNDVLIVTKLDRLARSTKDLLEIVEDLSKRNASLKILNINLDTSTPTGKLMLTMLGAIAEFERSLMLERQAEGIARAKDNGKYKGRVPKVKLRVEEFKQMRSEGKSFAKIAKEMNVGLSSLYRMVV
jgi:DNA invertase Pin-like site-specific DNA recombinase